MAKRKKKCVPLIKGATASSLAKQAAAAASIASKSNKKRKRNRSNNNNNNTNNNDGQQQQKQQQKLKQKQQKQKQHTFSSTAESLKVISDYHTLNKRLEQNERDTTITDTKREAIANQLRKEQDDMGGLDRYQKASMYGAKSSKFVCADWVVPLLLQSMKQNQTQNNGNNNIRILDVGAIDNQYQGAGYDEWLDAVPIDLHGGQHESVHQVDFFDYAHDYCAGKDRAATSTTSSNSSSSKAAPKPKPFDAIVMSLVLNFQGDPRRRGDMIALAADPRLLKAINDDNNTDKDKMPGMLFIALPSASLDNSRYCDLERFIQVVTNPNFALELVETKQSSKLILLAFQRKRTQTGSRNKDSSNRNSNVDVGIDIDSDVDSNTTHAPGACYDVDNKTFEYGTHEMKRLQPPKPGVKRNNFAVILKSSKNRE